MKRKRSQVIKRGKKLPEAKILSIFSQICAGLAHVHSFNILHRQAVAVPRLFPILYTCWGLSST